MNRRLLSMALTAIAFAALGVFSSAAFASKEKPVTTVTPFTAEYVEGAEYFGAGNTISCKGKHRTNSLKYPGIGNHGGEDVEHCKVAKGEILPSHWQVPGQPINIDDNFWNSDYDGQGVPFHEELPRYGVKSSKVSANGKAFKIVVIYPLSNFSVSVSQEVAESDAGFTSANVTGEVGQTVDYRIEVKNTGWVPLSFPTFSDPKCDPGTIAGGPGLGTIVRNETTTYTCSHQLTGADLTAGTYTDSASATGAPPAGDGPPFAEPSNTVTAEVVV